MNLERIAEIEADGMCTMEDETAELCRLARLGLRVEGATTAEVIGGKFTGNSRVSAPDNFAGKRVALVVLEDAN